MVDRRGWEGQAFVGGGGMDGAGGLWDENQMGGMP